MIVRKRQSRPAAAAEFSMLKIFFSPVGGRWLPNKSLQHGNEETLSLLIIISVLFLSRIRIIWWWQRVKLWHCVQFFKRKVMKTLFYHLDNRRDITHKQFPLSNQRSLQKTCISCFLSVINWLHMLHNCLNEPFSTVNLIRIFNLAPSNPSIIAIEEFPAPI